ncbi:hypothetical protein Dimus_020719 [Dionaea muscipula]
MVDVAARGSFMRKTPQAAWTILEDMAASSCQYTIERPIVASASTSEDTITNILQLDSITQLSSQIEMLNKNFANISLVAAANPSGTSQGAKSSKEQGTIEEQMQYLESPDQEEEAVNYVNPQWGDNNNQRWKQNNQSNRNYQNSSWKSNNPTVPAHINNQPKPSYNQAGQSSNQIYNKLNQQQTFQRNTDPPRYSQTTQHQQTALPLRPPPQGEEQSLKDMMSQFMSTMTTRMQNRDATINNLMTQIGQLANQNSNRPPGALPSDTETNPRDVKAITLRSGASYPEPTENHELPNTGSSTSRSPKKRKMKRSISGKGIEAEPES